MKRTVIVAQRLPRPVAVLTVAGSMKVGQVFTKAGIVTVLSTPSHTKYSYVVGGYEFVRTDVHTGTHRRPSTASIERIAQAFARMCRQRGASDFLPASLKALIAAKVAS